MHIAHKEPHLCRVQRVLAYVWQQILRDGRLCEGRRSLHDNLTRLAKQNRASQHTCGTGAGTPWPELIW
jgi:hypothetical protein